MESRESSSTTCFTPCFEDPNAPNAEPYFLKHSRVQNQLREQRGKNALLDKEVAGVQANSAKRFAFIQRTLANVFNQSMVSAFRKWRTEVQQISAKKEVLRNMTAKARRTISRKALGSLEGFARCFVDSKRHTSW